MKIFAENRKLEALFRERKAPKPETLLAPDDERSEWRVTMLTGALTIVYFFIGRWLHHRKLFVRRMIPLDDIGGCNVFFKDLRWGWFLLAKAVYAEKGGGDGQPVLLIDYSVKGNRFITDRIRDEVRLTNDPDELLGRFHFIWRGRKRFLGYFTLNRIK